MKFTWIIHLVLTIIMYGFYFLLWWGLFHPVEDNNMYHGDPALGVGLMILFTTPFFLLYHIIFI